MKQIKQLLIAMALLAMPVLVPVTAGAVEGDCVISGTGAGSDNECTNTNEYTCEVDNDNKVTILNNGTQVAESGNATSNDNQGGGTATSGSATNSTGTTFNFTIENGECVVGEVVEPKVPTVPTPVKPVVKGQGQGQGGVNGAVEAKPTVLANTGAIEPVTIGLAAVAVAAAVALGVRAYSAVVSRR